MKKKVLSIVLIVIGVLLIILGILFLLNGKNDSIPSFADTTWERQTDVDIEHIYFSKEKEFSYSEIGAGNPVGDFDLCETYSYNKDKEEIKINCDEYTSGNIKKIKVISFSKNKLVLDFNGEKKTFTKSND